MMATASGQPPGIEGRTLFESGAAARAWPPSAKQAITRIMNAADLIAAVISCVLRPQRIPRHCKTPKPTMTATAIIFTWPASTGKRWPLYSAITIPTAAAVPHVESQSLHPTMKPAYSPIARREKLYCPPLRGIDAPNSAIEDAPKSAYIPPTTQTPRNNHAFGRRLAMSPGVRTMPAEMVFPTAAAMPNHMPSTGNNFPRLRVAPAVTASVLVEDSADVLDNVESQECSGNSAIIMAARQNASRKSAHRRIVLGRVL